MKPSSSPSDAGLFDGVLAAGPVRAQVADRAWLRAMLDVEAALATALGAPPEAARAIAAARVDPAELGAAAAGAGNPVVPLVRALRAAVPPAVAGYVHSGATSQDVLDSAAMLVAHRALGPLLGDLAAAADAAARLAAAHRDTPVAARTLLQQALPTTFGLVAAGWLTALDEAADRLTWVRERRLAAQLGGAAGTLAALDLSTVDRFAAALGLPAPPLPWHTDRTRIADLAGALGTAAGVVAKVARDIVLYAQTEVGELAEDRPGGSSTLPHKRNPVAAISATACAAQAPGLVATLLGAMAHEHQRAAGAWHAEWRPLTTLLESAGAATYWLRVCLEGLRVDQARMRANLDLTGDALLAEQVSTALAPRLGPDAAHEAVRAALAAGHPLSALVGHPLDPTTYLGKAAPLTDRALHTHHARRSRGSQPRMPDMAPDHRKIDVHYRIDGPRDAPVLVLANSLGATLRMWDPQVPRLAERFRVVRFDTRGHGESPVPPGPYDLDDLGGDVLSLLDTLGVDKAHFCGLSLGGMVGMWLAAHAPERIDRLVLCCTSAALGPPRMWADRARTVRDEGTSAVADAGVARWLTPEFIEKHEGVAADLRDMIASTPPEGYAACCGVIERMDLTDALPGIRAATLVIAGADDPATPPVHGATIAAAIPGARIAIVPHAAHLANVEQPETVTALILEHLDG
ncbi:3-oxoadipate enol-lactonase [Actinomycetes bacterium KLBMP 9797]